MDSFMFLCYSQSTLPPPHQALPPHPQPPPPQPAPVHHSHAHTHQNAQSNGSGGSANGGFQQMARMMDSLILDNFGPFAFTKITTSHHHHRLPSRASALKKNSVGSTTNLPQTNGHGSTNGHSPASQTMRINMHRNSTSTASKVAYTHHGGELERGVY